MGVARSDPSAETSSPRWPGLGTLLWVSTTYLACVAVATYPVVLSIGSSIPGELTDPLEHLWILRWSKACWLEGRFPFFSDGLQAPTGVPLGYFPTMHLQSSLFLGLGLFTSNDVACFQVIWTLGFVSTGASGFLLAWWVTREVGPSWVAGLGLMLCGPLMMHAHGHLETMQMGAVPLFLMGWIRFVDRPDGGRLAVSAGLYLLMVAAAPYFAVLAVFPAAWYVVWSIGMAGPGDRRRWLESRFGWLSGFSGLVVPGLLLLFSGQVWAVGHGYSMDRPRFEFDSLGAPIWSSFVPSPRHLLGHLVVPDWFETTGYASRMSECSSYLGIVTLSLLAYALVVSVRFPRSGFWWSALLGMVVLSWGSDLTVSGVRIGLPAGWIYQVFPPFHLIRVPARFNLFAAACAVVPASAALRRIVGHWKRSSGRQTLIVGAFGLTLVDLSMTPFPSSTIPAMPRVYRDLADRNPDGRLVDSPMFGASEGQTFSALWGYWQATHRLATTGGYPGVTNVPFDTEIVPSSPWWSRRLADPRYLADPAHERFGPVIGVNAHDYAWLFLTGHGFDHVLIHQGGWFDSRFAPGTARIKSLMAEARSSEDTEIAVYDRSRLKPPEHLTWLCARGWRPVRHSSTGDFGVLKRARIELYQPENNTSVRLRLRGVSGFGRSRVVHLLEHDRDLARWTIEPGTARDLESPPLPMSRGLHRLILQSDGDDPPSRSADRLDDARTPYSLRLRDVAFESTVDVPPP